MEIHVLASGSTGNATCLKFGETAILVDAGISARRIKKGLDEVGIGVENLSAVLITHEHTDHTNGLTTLMKKYQVPVYTRPDTWDAISFRPLLPEVRCLPLSDSLDIGSVKVEPFSISHDAADPVGFSFYHAGRKCCLATDLGFVTDSVKQALDGSDTLVLEANHDLDMLRNGSYPWPLKRRILSNKGHLSNVDAGWTLARLAKNRHTDIFLAHLSRENNRPDIAQTTVTGILEEAGYMQSEDFTLYVTYPDRTVSHGEDGQR